MSIAGPEIVGRMVRFPNKQAVPTVHLSGSRTTVQATAVSTSEAALPADSIVVVIRSFEAVWLRFGLTGMGAASADDNSILFPAGESVIPVPYVSDGVLATYVRVIRAGANDTFVQFERINTVSGV
jgi:hypothetical protein